MLFNPIIYIKSRKSGFTLIEVMLVLAIMALLLVIVVPAYQKATATAQINRCIESLKGIDMAKEQYALDFNINQGITPSDSDIDPYLKGGIQRAKKCSEGGTILVEPIGVFPICSIHSGSLGSTAFSKNNPIAVTGTNFTKGPLTQAEPLIPPKPWWYDTLKGAMESAYNFANNPLSKPRWLRAMSRGWANNVATILNAWDKSGQDNFTGSKLSESSELFQKK